MLIYRTLTTSEYPFKLSILVKQYFLFGK